MISKTPSLPRLSRVLLVIVSVCLATIFAGVIFVGAHDDSSSDAPAVKAASTETRAKIAEQFGKLPLSFEVNKGQTAPAVKFLSRGLGYQLFLTGNEAVLVFLRSEDGNGCSDRTQHALCWNFDRSVQLSVICDEDAPFITQDEIKSTSANSFYGDARVRPTIKACAEWPQAKVAASFLDPVKSDVPVLLVSGELDPVTPPWLAQNVSKTLSRSRLLIVSKATHNSYECIENVVADFIDKGTTEGLDVSCLEKIRRPPFTVLQETK